MEYRSRLRGRDFFPLDYLARSRRALLMQPNKSVVENMRQGTAFVPSHRKRVVIPANHGLTQPRRVTIVNYDTSGSMVNAPGDFQASLLAAFTDRALSDRGASGRHNHQVALLGFDAEVHTIYEIKNSEQAYDIIRNHRTKMKNTNGLTDIMAALEQSFAAILDAQ